MDVNTPALNLNWGFTPQQEETLSASKGVEKITTSINDMVNKKIEDDRAYDKELLNVVSTTTGRYQDHVYKLIEEGKNKIKDIGKANWNSKELRGTRDQVLRQITASSKKANYIAERAPKILEEIKKDKYIMNAEANAAVTYELNKENIDDIDIEKIEGILQNPAYLNVPALTRDALNTYIGDEKFTSDSFNETKNGLITTSQYEYGKNWKVKKTDGKVEMKNGRPVIESALGGEQVRDIFAKSGYGDKLYQYFDAYFTKLNGDQLKGHEGIKRENLVYELAGDYLQSTVGAYSTNVVGTPRPVPVDTAALDLIKKRNTGIANQEIETRIRKQDYDEVLTSLTNGDSQSIKARVETLYPNVDNVVLAQWIGGNSDPNNPTRGFFREKGRDKILTLEEMITLGLMVKKENGLYDLTAAARGKYKTFTGVAWREPADKKKKISEKWTIVEGNFGDERNRKNMATALHNKLWRKGQIPYVTDADGYDATLSDDTMFENGNSYKDLIGLNYTPEEIQKYINDGTLKLK